ncbi:MAG: nucleotidyltransferase domain-containing protein [Candidatus Parabeggiatoa sp. nov. 1]|nr:MAG: nucleotidyltransferase domain-containing protein [Gammaproteobacteria bacterium]
MLINPIINKMVQWAHSHQDIAVMWLYGSHALQQQHINSDYDIAIAFISFPEDPVTRHLRPAMLAIDWANALKIPTEKLSPVDINLVPIPFAWEVITTGYIIYQDNTQRAFKEEQRISSRMEIDILWHRRHYG